MIPKNNKFKKPQYIKTHINGTNGKIKQFDEKLHSKYDINARKILKEILKDSIKENEDIYGEDLVFTLPNFPYKYLEVQVVSYWDSDNFPYTFPFVYSRKMRFSKKIIFVIFNKYLI